LTRGTIHSGTRGEARRLREKRTARDYEPTPQGGLKRFLCERESRQRAGARPLLLAWRKDSGLDTREKDGTKDERQVGTWSQTDTVYLYSPGGNTKGEKVNPYLTGTGGISAANRIDQERGKEDQ